MTAVEAARDRHPMAIVLVTHVAAESARLAQRVLRLDGRPGTLRPA
jgi:ABC-type nitrate/sulfonate/bicarbonate transport system ATPase subunit